MLTRTHSHSYLTQGFGAAAVAILIGALSAHPQTVTDYGGTHSDAGKTMNQGNQPASGASTSGTSGGTAASGGGTPSTAPSSSSQEPSATSKAGPVTSKDNTTMGATAATGTVSMSDRNLMRELASANLAEIEVAKLAQSQSQNEQVRSFAQKMVDDHTQASEKLMKLAQAKGVQLPDKPDAKHQALMKKLGALSGEAFDRQYLAQAGLSDHRNAHRLVQRISMRAKDPELKALADQMQPTIDQHLQMAQQMRSDKQGATSSGK